MKNVKMALCFLDEEDKVVAKRELNVTWKLDPNDKGEIETVIVMDEVANMLAYELNSDFYNIIRELLDEAQRSVK